MMEKLVPPPARALHFRVVFGSHGNERVASGRGKSFDFFWPALHSLPPDCFSATFVTNFVCMEICPRTTRVGELLIGGPSHKHPLQLQVAEEEVPSP